MSLLLSDRILLCDGTSIVTDERASELILKMGGLPDHIRVAASGDADKYKVMFEANISHDMTENTVPGETKEPSEEEVCEVLERISMKRDRTIPDEAHNNRVRSELEFFTKNNLIPFLVSCHKLIRKFKDDNTIWGVGRGSSCASYILYLLEVHDVNPLKYKIPFCEFSKETE